MKSFRIALASGLTLTLLAVDAGASSVGAFYLNPNPGRQVQPASANLDCQSGNCQSASCGQCQRLGFACVDHAGPAPCTAEGGCTPNRGTFGYTKTRWRRWPGTSDDDSSGKPTEADGDSLLAPYETPVPEKEDQHAPPPIEDESEEGDRFEEGTGVEIDLPPLPQGRPEAPRPEAPRPAPPRRPGQPNFGNEPPPLPFGQATPNPSSSRPMETAGQGDRTRWNERLRLPQAPFQRSGSRSVKTTTDNAPPPLPAGFTSVGPAKHPRRLPTSVASGRLDPAVLPASATVPVSR